MNEKAELTTIRMRPSLREALDKAAEEWGISKTRLLDEAISARLGLGIADSAQAKVPRQYRRLLEEIAVLITENNPGVIKLLEAVVVAHRQRPGGEG